MDNHLQQIIYNDNKTLFKTKPFYGIETDNGWFSLIYKLCELISFEMKGIPSEAYPSVDTIKEKFGGLRFYYSWMNSSHNKFDMYSTRIDNIVYAYEQMSFTVCETCGATQGVHVFTINKRLIKTQCSSCNDKERK